MTFLATAAAGAPSLLTTTLISFTSAIILLILAQVILHFREEKKFYREKLQALLENLSEFSEGNTGRIGFVMRMIENHKNEQFEFEDVAPLMLSLQSNRLMALVSLYFPSLAQDMRAAIDSNRKLIDYVIYHQGRDFIEFEDQEFRFRGQNLAMDLDAMRQQALEHRDALVRSVPGLIGYWWRRKCDGE